MQDEYDYIVCGGGTSGCVVASRLAEDPSIKVLLLEAGVDAKDVEFARLPTGFALIAGTPQDWNIISTPQTQLDNRVVNLSRGKFLGGSSGINGTACFRGLKIDYDRWDLPGWSGDEFFAAMDKADKLIRNEHWFAPDPKAHLKDGLLKIAPDTRQAPISSLVLSSLLSQGFQLVPDMFSSGETVDGTGFANYSNFNGERRFAVDFLDQERRGSNLTVLVNTTVDKINFLDDCGTLRTSSVDVVSSDGSRRRIKTRREIIISAGVYCTPPILMRSGIGPREELEKYEISCHVDSPGVGSNLQDHLIANTRYETDKSLTIDEQLAMFEQALEQWKMDRTGVLSNSPIGPVTFARISENGKSEDSASHRGFPHVEHFSTEFYSRSLASLLPPPGEDPKFGFSFYTQLHNPRSTGTVKLKSKDPLENPIVDHNYLGDPMDVAVLAEGLRRGNEIITNGVGTKNIIQGVEPAICSKDDATAEDYYDYIRATAGTDYHPTSTAKMGKKDDKYAVLDEKLRVRGVEGLRVADCSVMPNVPAGHTQMPAYGIGEKCAEFIKLAWE